jgi:hypothetical protein
VISKVEKARAERRYVVMNRTVKLKQSTDLEEALTVFDRPIKLVSG